MKQLPQPESTNGNQLPAPAAYPVKAPYEQPVTASDPQGGLLEYWGIIRRRKGTLILIAFLGALSGLLVSLPQTPVYQAKTSLEIQDINDSFLNMSKVNPVSETSNASMSLTDIQTQIKIIQSDTLTERVLDKLKLQKNKDLSTTGDRLTAWRKALNLGEPEALGEQAKALKMAGKSLKVRAAGQTRIVEILVDSTDPKLAAAFANTLTNEFIEQNMEARWKMSERTGVWLTRQLDEMRVKLERSEDALQSYARQAGLMFTAEKNSVAEEKLRQLQDELSKAQGDRISKQSRMEMATRAAAETLPDVLNDVSLRDYQVKLTDLRRQRSELITVYTPTHLKVKKVDAEIEALESALQRERTAIIRRIRNEFDEAERREKLLTIDYGTQAQLVTGQSEKSIHYNILKREVDSNRQLYDAMLQKMKEASVASAMRASNVRVVDAAKASDFPYKPNISSNAGLGLLSGIFLGISFVIMRERANRTIQEPGDAAYFLGIKELGAIPCEGAENQRPFYFLPGRTRERDQAVEKVDRPRIELATWQRKPSALAESYRAVLTSILFSNHGGDGPKTLLFTSSGPKEGKTTSVCNLGIALTEVGRKVLLIDADLRRPRLHDVFDVVNERGLAEVLRDARTDSQALKGVIQESKIPGLFIFPSGAATSSAANLLHAPTLVRLLRQLSCEFDMILVDTPPMLQMPDARVVARSVDGVILIVRSGSTTRDAAVAATKRFLDDNTNIIGVILNDWDPRHSPNGYYGYYSGHYYNTYRQYSISNVSKEEDRDR